MKKIVIILLCLVLLFTFVGCNLFDGGNPDTGTPDGNGTGTGNSSGSGTGTGSGSGNGTGTGSGSGSGSGSGTGNGENNNGGNTQDPPSDDDGTIIPFSDEATAKNDNFYKKYSSAEKDLYYLLWQETTTITVKIDIEPYELAKINEAFVNYQRTGNSKQMDTYRMCNLTITVNGVDYYFEEVGIRMRGNTSKREFCGADGNVYAFVHFRFNLSETFDGDEYAPGSWGADIAKTWTDSNARAERKDRSFATMEKFYYKWNKNYDNTYVREVYANRMFRAYGVLAPHITLSQIMLKQSGAMQNLGVGTLYETIDKQFIKRNFSKKEAGGDLYKCAYPANLTKNPNYGVETPTQRFTYTLKTNNDRNAPDYKHNKDFLALIDMLNSVNLSKESDRAKLEALVDMDYFTNFEAVNYLLGNPDCIRNNMNNYYMYFVPTTGKMYLIPYDYDRCLGINVDWNPTGNGMTTLTPYTLNGAAVRTEKPLYTKTILSSVIAYYQQMYQAKLQTVLDGQWFTYENFQSMFKCYKSNYEYFITPSALIVQQCNVNVNRLVMSERGTTNLWDLGDNISTQLYMQLKRQCASENLTKIK